MLDIHFVSFLLSMSFVLPRMSSRSTLLACSPVLHVLQRHSHQLEVNFEAPLKEFVRMVKSAKNVMQDRSTALTTLQQVRCNTWLLLRV